MPDPRQDRGRPPLAGRRPDDPRSPATIPPKVALTPIERERIEQWARGLDHRILADEIVAGLAPFLCRRWPSHPEIERGLVADALADRGRARTLLELEDHDLTDLPARLTLVALRECDLAGTVDLLSSLRRVAPGFDAVAVVGEIGAAAVDLFPERLAVVRTAAAVRRAVVDHEAACAALERWKGVLDGAA